MDEKGVAGKWVITGKVCKGVRIMVFNATFNAISVISWWSALLVEETGVPRENQLPYDHDHDGPATIGRWNNEKCEIRNDGKSVKMGVGVGVE